MGMILENLKQRRMVNKDRVEELNSVKEWLLDVKKELEDEEKEALLECLNGENSRAGVIVTASYNKKNSIMQELIRKVLFDIRQEKNK